MSRLWRDFIKSTPSELVQKMIGELAPEQLHEFLWDFEFWAHEHQLPPCEDYQNWVILGGRGAGKTRAGAEWVRHCVEGRTPLERGAYQEVALLGASLQEIHDVMIFGPSGIMATAPPDFRPQWNGSRKQLVWPNGARAFAFSARDPERLRGAQFDAAWCDEFAKWKNAREAWDMLQFGLRIGDAPKCLITTTPRSLPLLREILAQDGTVSTHGDTYANREYLSGVFLNNIEAHYGHTWLGRQEIDGVFVDDQQDGLWHARDIEMVREDELPSLDRVVIAIDPAVSSNEGSDECGIVVAGAIYPDHNPKSWKAYVLQDASVNGATPEHWAERALELYERHGAFAVIAEVNQGGELIETVLRMSYPFLNYFGVHAKTSKAARAESIAALYRQGRVGHVAGLAKLEAQMLAMTRLGYQGRGSPDRMDAMVWALHELMIKPMQSMRTPRLLRL